MVGNGYVRLCNGVFARLGEGGERGLEVRWVEGEEIWWRTDLVEALAAVARGGLARLWI